MVSPSQKRRAIRHVVGRKLCSIVLGCSAVRLARSSYYRRPELGAYNRRLLKAIERWSRRKPRWGYAKITTLLRAGGWKVNKKRVARLRRLAGLQVMGKSRKRRRLGQSSSERRNAEYPNQVWSWDFIEDRTETGRKIKVLTVVDEKSRLCVAHRVEHGMGAAEVIEEIGRAMARQGTPEHIRSDNGPEFIAQAIQNWLAERKVKTLYIDPGSPWQNPFVESFNAQLRRDCLDAEVFGNLTEAKVLIGEWIRSYNQERPHGSLDQLTPVEFLGRWNNNQINQSKLTS